MKPLPMMKSTPLFYSILSRTLVLILIGGLVSCTSTQKSTGDINDPLESANPHGSRTDVRNNDNSDPRQLSDLLRTVPGLNITGSGNNVVVVIRGMRSFQGPNEPMYVIDGTPVGRDYNSVANSVNVQDVKSVRVLKGSQASIYGSRGANGVIVIKMKKGS